MKILAGKGQLFSLIFLVVYNAIFEFNQLTVVSFAHVNCPFFDFLVFTRLLINMSPLHSLVNEKNSSMVQSALP